jgi:hypothetical protein
LVSSHHPTLAVRANVLGKGETGEPKVWGCRRLEARMKAVPSILARDRERWGGGGEIIPTGE